MSQEFPTAPLDISENFHILHSAYVYICYSIFKAKHTTGSLITHTHTHTYTHTSNNSKQKANGNVTSFANGRLTDSDAPFVCEIPTAASE